MDFDKDKVDEATLALLWLVFHEDRDGATRAWKSFDWGTLDVGFGEFGHRSRFNSASGTVNSAASV